LDWKAPSAKLQHSNFKGEDLRMMMVKALRMSVVPINLNSMNTVEEIKLAIEKLPTEEIEAVAKWLEGLREEMWDKKIAADAQAGRLDKLIEEAEQDYRAGHCKPLP
jgi:transcriptional accessory protein Tex/SPT6